MEYSNAASPNKNTMSASTAPKETAGEPPAGAPIATPLPQSRVTSADLAARGRGTPGRGAFTGERIIIPRIDVDAPLVAVVVGADGQMPPPPSLDVVAWYDFSAWPGLGGLPGAGGNVILAGDAIVAEGSGVFTYLGRVVAGDYVKLRLTGGTILCYRVEWNKNVDTSEVAFEDIVAATAGEYLTLITGGTAGSTHRLASAPRADCAAEPAPTPTRTPQSGHQQLHIVAEGSRITAVEGDFVPLPIHTVDILFDNVDKGVVHHIVFYDPSGAIYFDIGEVEGPRIGWTAYMPAGPRTGAPQRYTFACVVHPGTMRGAITVE